MDWVLSFRLLTLNSVLASLLNYLKFHLNVVNNTILIIYIKNQIVHDLKAVYGTSISVKYTCFIIVIFTKLVF